MFNIQRICCQGRCNSPEAEGSQNDVPNSTHLSSPFACRHPLWFIGVVEAIGSVSARVKPSTSDQSSRTRPAAGRSFRASSNLPGGPEQPNQQVTGRRTNLRVVHVDRMFKLSRFRHRRCLEGPGMVAESDLVSAAVELRSGDSPARPKHCHRRVTVLALRRALGDQIWCGLAGALRSRAAPAARFTPSTILRSVGF